MPSQGKTDPGISLQKENAISLKSRNNLGIRNQIFSPIYQNNDGYYALDESFVTANVMIKCDASWTSDVYDNFNQYVRGT